jgi:hypothetical protein
MRENLEKRLGRAFLIFGWLTGLARYLPICHPQNIPLADIFGEQLVVAIYHVTSSFSYVKIQYR